MYSNGIWGEGVPHFKNSKRAGVQKVVTAKCGLVYGNNYTISIFNKAKALHKTSTQLNVTVITSIFPCSQKSFKQTMVHIPSAGTSKDLMNCHHQGIPYI
jgi:hypothetical protein